MSKVLIVKNEDKRMMYLTKYLAKIYDVVEIENELHFYYELQKNDYETIVLPLRGISDNQIIDGTTINFTDNYFKLAKEKSIYTGLITDVLEKKCQENKIRLVSYLTEDIAIKNNYLTIEGIVEKIATNSDKGIYGSNVLIIGYGKLGTICAKILQAFKANISITCRDKKDFLQAKLNDYQVYSHEKLINIINNFDFIINTVPYPIITHNIIEKITNKEMLIIDVSSRPYGMDHDYARACLLNTLLLPGIPGKVAPKSAGELIGEFIHQDMCGGEL